MKPKEFIEKYGIQGGWNPKHQTNFLQDFTSELIVMLEYNKAVDNIKGFDNALRTIRQKWDAISNKIRFFRSTLTTKKNTKLKLPNLVQ